MLNDPYAVWALAYPEAAAALRAITVPTPAPNDGASEARVQSLVRLEAAQKGYRLFRNNKGVLRDDRGVPVRFGLCNDNKKVSDMWASADLIGWNAEGQFTSVEVKKWDGVPTEAQENWAKLVRAGGGLAFIVNQEGMLP